MNIILIIIVIIIFVLLLLMFKNNKFKGGDLKKAVDEEFDDDEKILESLQQLSEEEDLSNKGQIIQVKDKNNNVIYLPVNSFKGETEFVLPDDKILEITDEIINHIEKISNQVIMSIEKLTKELTKILSDPLVLLTNMLTDKSSVLAIAKHSLTVPRIILSIPRMIKQKKFDKNLLKPYIEIMVQFYKVNIFKPLIVPMLKILSTASLKRFINNYGLSVLSLPQHLLKTHYEFMYKFTNPNTIRKHFCVILKSKNLEDVKNYVKQIFKYIIDTFNDVKKSLISSFNQVKNVKDNIKNITLMLTSGEVCVDEYVVVNNVCDDVIVKYKDGDR